MRELETASLGQVKKLGKSTVFYKAIPNTLIHTEHHLGNLNVSLDQFKDKKPENQLKLAFVLVVFCGKKKRNIPFPIYLLLCFRIRSNDK